jgi:hypothetical protein
MFQIVKVADLNEIYMSCINFLHSELLNTDKFLFSFMQSDYCIESLQTTVNPLRPSGNYMNHLL